MAQYDRPPKKKEKKVDEFISFFDHLVRYFAIHRYKLMVVLAAGALAFAGYGIYLYWQNHQVEEFAVLYSDASQAPAADALKRWEDLAGKNPPLRLDDVVFLQIGGILSGNSEWKKAAEEFSRTGDSPSPLLKYLGQLAGATALENSGDFNGALEAYQRLSQEVGSPFQYQAKFGMARCFGAMGQAAEAETILFQLIAGDSGAPQGIKLAAQNRLIVMKLNAAAPGL
jgi:hypothetical protein